MTSPASRLPTATPLEVAMSATARLNAAEAEIANLRTHLDAVAFGAEPDFAAARSARIIAAEVERVADQLRDLAARQSLVV